ncbi:hypothetical protein HOD38_05095 [archaeon]|jgi:hypothetical protein|nr:hypothetical protein [archaeon]MBT4397616.1 hypothetical protein [archaeon]MBT4441085.1 hypothetical protein [archaeon]
METTIQTRLTQKQKEKIILNMKAAEYTNLSEFVRTTLLNFQQHHYLKDIYNLLSKEKEVKTKERKSQQLL